MNITQKELIEVVDNPIDSMPSKIKEKPESLATTINNVLNVPFLSNEVVVKEEKVEKDEETKVEIEEENKETDKSFSIIQTDKLEVVDGGNKQIKVKERMLDNIMKINNYSSNENVVEEQVPVEKEEVVEKNEVVENKVTEPVQEEVKEEVKEPVREVENNTPVDMKKSFDKQFAEVTDETEKIVDLREKARNAKMELDESEKKLQETDIRYSESEKEKQEAEARYRELKQKVLQALENQKTILKEQTKKYQDDIRIANESKEINENKTREIQSKIDSNVSETTSLNEENSKLEGILNVLTSDNTDNIINLNNNEEEKINKKIA